MLPNLQFLSLFAHSTQPCPCLQVPAVRGVALPSTSTQRTSTACRPKPNESPLRRHSRLEVQLFTPHPPPATSARQLLGISLPRATRYTRRYPSSTTPQRTAQCQAPTAQQLQGGTPAALLSSTPKGTVPNTTPQCRPTQLSLTQQLHLHSQP